MLAAERAENERLRQIIKDPQRHRFGRRAESLPIDQLLLGLDEFLKMQKLSFWSEVNLSLLPTVVCRIISVVK